MTITADLSEMFDTREQGEKLHGKLEPETRDGYNCPADAALTSIAISLKRIADGNAAVGALFRLKKLVDEIEAGLDLEDLVADGGITGRMVWVKAARDALGRVR